MELITVVFCDMARPLNSEPTYISGKKGKARIYWRGHQADLPGPKDSPESLQAFYAAASLIVATGAWAAGPEPAKVETVAMLAARYHAHCLHYYRGKSRQALYINYALKAMTDLFGALAVADFGPVHLKAVRKSLIDRGQVRRTANKRAAQIVACFAWGVEEGLIDAAVWQRIKAVKPIPKGREGALDNPKKKPITATQWELTLEHVSPAVRVALQVQRLTGMRSGELLAMKPQDVDMSGEHWIYTVKEHKTAAHIDEKLILIPKPAAELLVEHMPKLFTDRWFPWTVGWQQKAVLKAAQKAGVPHWYPHQLRHGFATEVANRINKQAAQWILGHTDERTTETYAKPTADGLIQLANILFPKVDEQS